MIKARLGGAVSCLRGHGPPPQARGDIQYAALAVPIPGCAQKCCRELHGCLQSHAQRMRQVDGVRLTEGFDAADDTRVIDQRDMGELFVSLRVQPLLKPCAGLVTVSQVL